MNNWRLPILTGGQNVPPEGGSWYGFLWRELVGHFMSLLFLLLPGGNIGVWFFILGYAGMNLKNYAVYIIITVFRSNCSMLEFFCRLPVQTMWSCLWCLR